MRTGGAGMVMVWLGRGVCMKKKSRKLEVLSRSGEKEKEGRPARTGILIL